MSSAGLLHPQPQLWVRSELGPVSSRPSLCTGTSAQPGRPQPLVLPGTPGSLPHSTAPTGAPGAGECACVGPVPSSHGAPEGQAGGWPSCCCLSRLSATSGPPSLSLQVSFCAFCSMGVPLARVWMPRGPAWDHFPFLRSWGTKATPRFRFRGCGRRKKLRPSQLWQVGFHPASGLSLGS